MAHFIPTAARYVESITIVNGGSGFGSSPTLTFTGGGGTGATATAEVVNGSIFSVTVTNPGDGYTSSPTITVTGGGGGTGAVLVAVLGYALKPSQYTDTKLAYRIKEQFPQFYATDYPKFITFMEKYYEFMDTEYEKVLNPDLEFFKGTYIDEWINQLGLTFPKNSVSDKQLLYSHINDIYQSKGSIKSIQAFFRFAYGVNVEVEYPSEYIFKASDGRWVEEQALKVEANTFFNAVTQKDEEYNLFDLVGKAIHLKYFENAGEIRLERLIDASVQNATKIAYTFPSNHTFSVNFDIPRTAIPGPGAGAEFYVITSGALNTFTTGSADASRTNSGSPYTIGTSDYTVTSNYGNIKSITVGAANTNRPAGTYKIDLTTLKLATTSLTIAGATATANFISNHGLQNNETVEISGATPSQYNGRYKITNVTATTFDFTPASTPAGNATVQPTVEKTVDYTTTSTHGTGAQFTVVVDALGAATVTIDNEGDYYEPGKTVTIPDNKLGSGGAPRLVLTIDRVTRASAAEFTVAVDGSGEATVTVDNAGAGFMPGDTITIPDSNLGSGGGADLVLKVVSLTSGVLNRVIVVDGGAAYLAAPSITISDRGNNSVAAGAEVTVLVENNKITSIRTDSAGTNYNSNEVVAELDLSAIRTQVLSSDETIYGYLVRTLINISAGVYDGSAVDVGFRVGQIYDLSETGISTGYAVAPSAAATQFFGAIVFSELTSSLTIAGSTATATFIGNHGMNNGDTVSITGAVPAEFNGTYTISNVTAKTFDYTPLSVPAGNATTQGFVIKSTGTDDGSGYFGQPYVFIGGSRNARVRVASVSDAGIPLSWEIVGAGSDFVNETTTITLTSPNGEQVDVTIMTGYLFNYDGYWKDARGKPSDVNRFQDNNRYQNYSYVVKGPVQSADWLPTFLPVMHPAGLAVFGDFIIEHNIDETSSFNIETEEIGIYKVEVDNTTITENIDNIHLDKVETDTVSTSDVDNYSMTKVLTHTATTTETDAKDFTKILADTVTVIDTLSRVVNYIREPSDSVTVTDADFLIGKRIEFTDNVSITDLYEALFASPETDSASATEESLFAVNKVISDNPSATDAINSINTGKELTDTANATESNVIAVDFTKSDSATTSDGGFAHVQDYAEPGYFNDIYIGAGAFF